MENWLDEVFECEAVVEMCAMATSTGGADGIEGMAIYFCEGSDEAYQSEIVCVAVAAGLLVSRAFGLEVRGLPEEIDQEIEQGTVYFSVGDLCMAVRLLERATAYLKDAAELAEDERSLWSTRLAQVGAPLLEMVSQGVAVPTVEQRLGVNFSDGERSVEEGELVGVPLDEESSALGKVLFVSSKWRGLIVVAVGDEVLRAGSFASSGPRNVQQVLNTTDAGIRLGVWKRLGREAVTQAEEKYCWWIDGREVWHGDERVRAVTDSDYLTVRKRRLVHDLRAEQIVRATLRRVPAGDPKGLALGYHLRGLHFSERGEFETAVRYFDRALQIAPRQRAVYLARAQAWERLGKRELAQRDRKRAGGTRPGKRKKK
jgi:tetratricopeptide (TPR) repeat protein